MGNIDFTLKPTSIKSMALQERPREKLLQKGRAGLTDAELLAILIGSGTRQYTALDIGRNLLQSVEYDLRQLGRLTAQELCKFEGLGEAKAVSIVSALELGRRRMCAPQTQPRSQPGLLQWPLPFHQTGARKGGWRRRRRRRRRKHPPTPRPLLPRPAPT